MNYKLEDLIDIPLIQVFLDRLNEVMSYPSAIIDNESNILTATNWQDICTKFYRANPESEKECKLNDQYILSHIKDGNFTVTYRCPHGLVDNATPIIIEGKHIGNFFIGQLFPRYNEKGEISEIFGTSQDITEHKRNEEELRKYHDHLEELVKERTVELNKKNVELERFNKFFVGRELRMIELKKQIVKLENELEEIKKKADRKKKKLGINMKNSLEMQDIKWNKSTCPYCGFGCSLMVCVKQGMIVEIKGMKGHPVNDGQICALAANIPPIFDLRGRLTRPMIRRGDEFISVTWKEAIDHTANEFKRIIKKYGPDSVAFYGGAANLTEEFYLMNKLMKGLIGTNNIECSTRLCMASSAAGFLSTIGADAPPTCYADIEEADLFFIAGNNMALTVPVMFRRISKAKEKNGAKVIVVDPRRTKTSELADLHLQIRPGTDVALNNSIAYVLLKEGFVDEGQVEQYASGLSDLKRLIGEFSPSKGALITGLQEHQIIEAARMIGNARAMLTFWFQGYNHSTQAVFKNNTLHNLSLLTGNICRPGAGPLSITGEANALGNRWVGALSHLLVGMRQITSEQHRREVAKYWGVPEKNIRTTPGRSIMEIIEGLHSGEIRALWITSTNPAASLPDTRWVEEGLAKPELLVVQDILHPTETTVLADVILAAAQWCEKTGTFISSERRIELVEKLIEPPGEAKPDYEIIWLVARAMGFEKEFPYASPEEVFEEWKGLTKGRLCDMGGVTYERLRGAVGPQLPCPAPGHPGTGRLFTDMHFPRPDGRAALLFRDYIMPAENPDREYPFILITGCLEWHFNTRTRTARVPLLDQQAPVCMVEFNPKDAAMFEIKNQDLIEVTSRRGKARGKACITDSIQAGMVFMPYHFGKMCANEDSCANNVTNPAYDIHSKQPEYKFTAVRIEKIPVEKG